MRSVNNMGNNYLFNDDEATVIQSRERLLIIPLNSSINTTPFINGAD